MKFIGIKTRFVAFHRFRDAPDAVAYLRDYHRHTFNVEVMMEVNKSNRELEFFIVKNKIDNYINVFFKGKKLELSCESIADKLYYILRALYPGRDILIKIQEDNENYAWCEYGKQ